MLGAALGWKYDHAPGIETRDGQLTMWPESLGPAPSLVEQRQIITEYETYLSAQVAEPDRMDVLESVLEDKGLVTKAERDTKREGMRRLPNALSS